MMPIKNIRDAIADHLIFTCINFEGFYQPGIADNSTERPFGVVILAGEQPDGPMRKTTVQIAVHISAEDTADLGILDSLCHEVENALDGVDVDCLQLPESPEIPHWITPAYVGTTSDFPDEDRGTIFRLVEFEVGTARYIR
jgi:hypothetical protein